MRSWGITNVKVSRTSDTLFKEWLSLLRICSSGVTHTHFFFLQGEYGLISPKSDPFKFPKERNYVALVHSAVLSRQ